MVLGVKLLLVSFYLFSHKVWESDGHRWEVSHGSYWDLCSFMMLLVAHVILSVAFRVKLMSPHHH